MEASTSQIRVIIADDDPMARRALREGLSERGLVVIADLEDGSEAVGLCVHYRPDVVVMDMMMPGLDGVGATRELARRVPEAKVLLITRSEDAALALLGLRAGAAGFLRKDTDLDVLADAVRRTAAGQAMVDPQVVAALIDDMRLSPVAGVGMRPVSSPLTDREWEVLDALCVGLTTEQVADRFVLSLETVRSHVKSIFRKIGVHSQAEAIAAAAALRRPAGPLDPDGRGG
ncbi:MAG: response regulator transcription factor [Solirubrobacterales bacterium]|nr:response regulator transcription factor [Solirubrobacterales bacterium]